MGFGARAVEVDWVDGLVGFYGCAVEFGGVGGGGLRAEEGLGGWGLVFLVLGGGWLVGGGGGGGNVGGEDDVTVEVGGEVFDWVVDFRVGVADFFDARVRHF